METRKLLIADSSDELRQALTDILGDRYTIRGCSCGNQALELLRNFLPDILLLDLMLPGIDGITLLQQAAKENLHPRVLVTTDYHSTYIMDALARADVDYIMRRPCSMEALVCRIEDMTANLHAAPMPQADPQSVVSGALMALGFSPKLDGFSYLQAAIPLFAQNPQQAITKELYYAVGALFKKQPSLVERSIRSAIDTAWRQRSERVWLEYFTPTPEGTVARPTNGQLIGSLSRVLLGRMHSSISA